jgi:elongation factor G
MERYLEDETRSRETRSSAAIRKGTITRECNPVFCGSALKNIGVQRLIDGVIDYLPARGGAGGRGRRPEGRVPRRR